MFLALTCLAMMMACGGSSNKGTGGSEQGAAADGKLADGKWPAAIYDKYGISEMETKGRIVYTQFDNEGPYQYEVCYKDVTKEELLAWVESLKAKGFRISPMHEEWLKERAYEHDVMIYQPEEGKDMRLRVSFDWKQNMAFEYYTDEPNPAFEVVTHEEDGEESSVIEYNVQLSLNPIEKKVVMEGSSNELKLTADDLKGIDHMRIIEVKDRGVNMAFFGDHILTEADVTAWHEKMADALAAKGATFANTLSGKELTLDQLKADKVRSYVVTVDGKRYMMMARSDSSIGEFGGSILFMFTPMR